MEKTLEIINLEIGYESKGRKNSLISRISLSASKGELITLIGMNGSGKSTLLRSIANFQKILDGEILLQQKNISHYKLSDLAQKLSFVSTEHAHLNNITVREIIELGRYPYTGILGKLSENDRAIIDEVISQTSLEQIITKKLHEISDGEKQRVMIARALAQDTEIILLDEPTAYLDIQNRFEIVRLLKSLTTEKNKTVLFSTHDLAIALQLSDKIWLISENTITEGAPEDLVLNHKFSNLFTSDKIKFDVTKGDFIYAAKSSKQILLKGTGQVFEWTHKALKRNGYELTNNNQNITCVSIKSDGHKINWEIEKENSKFVVTSIYDLIRFLNKQ